MGPQSSFAFVVSGWVETETRLPEWKQVSGEKSIKGQALGAQYYKSKSLSEILTKDNLIQYYPQKEKHLTPKMKYRFLKLLIVSLLGFIRAQVIVIVME